MLISDPVIGYCFYQTYCEVHIKHAGILGQTNDRDPRGPFYYYGSPYFRAWISNVTHSFVWVVINHQCTNLNGGLVHRTGNVPLSESMMTRYTNMFMLGKQIRIHVCPKSTYYDDVIMTTIASQITSLTVVYSTVYSDADQRKHQSSASLAFVWGIHRDRWIPRTKGQSRGKFFHLMTSSCARASAAIQVIRTKVVGRIHTGPASEGLNNSRPQHNAW